MRTPRRIVRPSGNGGGNPIPLLKPEEAKRILDMGHHRYQQSCIERVASALGGSGPNLLQPHFVSSPLCSASLLASALKHRILRNMEHVNTAIIRRTLDLVEDKNPIWQHESSQSARFEQCRQVKAFLEGRLKTLQLKLVFNEGDLALERELAAIQQHLAKVSLLMQHMEPEVSGSLHPTSLQQDERVFLTPTEIAQLPSPRATIRGILVRLKGPRRGNRSMVWQKSAGRISINSVKYVVAEEAKLPIPSRIGVFGLTVRIVYSKRDRLVNCRSPLNLADKPGFILCPPTL